MIIEGDSVDKLTAEDFQRIHFLTLSHGKNSTETFVLTNAGKYVLAVSLAYGYNYTRPQLIAKYRNVGAVCSRITKNPAPNGSADVLTHLAPQGA